MMTIRPRFHCVYLAAVFVLVACFPKEEAKDPAAAEAAKDAGLAMEKNEHAGTVPLVVVNKTKAPIAQFELQPAEASGYDGRAYLIGTAPSYPAKTTRSANPDIPPGGRGEFKLAAAKYRLSMSTQDGAGGDGVLIGYKVDLSGPTELVIYDGASPPAEPPAAGMKQLVTMTWRQETEEKKVRDKAAGDANAKANAQVCMKNVPSKSEKAAPGKIKVDGKWSCILGGAYSGTDIVNLQQLAGGNIQATISGADRNNTWEGVVVGDEVHFRFAGIDLSGGKIKVDPGGKAMSGKAWTYAESRCNEWTLTCNKN